MDNQSAAQNNHWVRWMFAALWFCVWQYIYTWQTWLDPTRRIPGPVGDNTVMLWNLGWVKHALEHGHPGFWFANAYYPDGFLFLYGTHTWLDGLLGWLFSPVLPAGIGASILWANITMVIATVGSGLAIIAALRAWGVRNWPILLLVSSGAVFSWFRMFALQGHYHFFGTQWMLLTLALVSYSRRAFLEKRPGKAVKLMAAGGAALGVTFLNDQTMAVFAGILGGLVILSGAITRREKKLKNLAFPAALFYGLALVPASIHLVPIVVAIADKSFQYKAPVDGPRLVDATSLILPPGISWHGSKLAMIREKYGFTWTEGTYLGLVPLLLLGFMTFAAASYIVKKPADRSHELRLPFYAAICAWAFIVLGLGDTLLIGREQFASMPGRLLKAIPIINNIRLPQRWVWPSHLCIALGGSSSLLYFFRNHRSRRLQWFLLVLAVIPPLEAIRYPAVLPVDYRSDAFIRPPGLIESVQQQYKGGGVLVMPAEVAYAHSNIFQFQWGYDIPITVAYTARMPWKIEDLPWKGNSWTPETGGWLRKKDVRMVVFAFHGGPVEEFQSWINEAKTSVPGLVVLNRFGEPI